MEIGAIVQGRMSSTRFPGKVLSDLAGKPLLQYVLQALQNCRRLEAIVVATSDDPSDDAIERYCRRCGVACHRGPLHHVARRFHDVATERGWDAFVRISADSPLLDYRLVDRALQIATQEPFDLVTNLFPRSFPRGQSVEVVHAAGFREAVERFVESEDLEHVTRYYYAHAAEFRILNIAGGEDCSHLHLAVDTPRDKQVVERILEWMDQPHWSYPVSDIITIYRSIHGALERNAA